MPLSDWFRKCEFINGEKRYLQLKKQRKTEEKSASRGMVKCSRRNERYWEIPMPHRRIHENRVIISKDGHFMAGKPKKSI